MASTPPPASSDDSNRITSGTKGKPSYTYLGDWVWLSEAPDHAIRIYLALRAFVFDKDDDWTVTLTDSEIATLTRRSIASVKRSRKVCYKHGLLEELGITTKSVPGEPGQKPQARTERTLRIAQEPPQGYAGPVNCYSEVRKARKARETPGHSDGADVTSQSDQAKQGDSGSTKDEDSTPCPAGSNETPGHSDGADVHEGRADLHEGRADLHGTTPDDQGKPGPQVPFPSAFPNQPTTAEDEAAASEEPGSGDEWLVGGSTDQQHEQEQTPAEAGDTDTAGTRLLRKLPLPAGATPLTTQAVGQWAPLVDAYLVEQNSPVALIERLTNGLRDTARPAGVVVSRLKDLHAERECAQSSGTSAPDVPPWCGQCGDPTDPERDRKCRANPRMRIYPDGTPCSCRQAAPQTQAA